jgi:peroxiredoxin
LQTIYNEYKSKGLEIIAINQGDDAKTINGYLRENGFTFPVVMDNGEATSRFGVSAVPANFLLDAKGKIVWQEVGTVDEKELRAALKQAGLE